MSRIGISLWLCLMCWSGLAAAGDCIPKAEMQEIAQHFTQFSNLANKDYCLDDSQTSNLISAIVFMRKTRFASAMPRSADDLFSGRFANDWYGYFIGRITDFAVQDSCPKGVGAYVYFFGNSMYVCPLILSSSFTALDRASVFMHEARHIDGFPHMTCSRGARAGLQGACDQEISDGGSYAVTVETYAQLGRYAPDLHPALRAYARASAVIYADEAFEAPVRINRENGFLLVGHDSKIYRVSGDGQFKVEARGVLPALGHIVMRANHMVLYPDDKNLTARYVFADNEGETPMQAGALAVEYNAMTPAERASQVDLHVSAQWVARAFNNRIEFGCDPRSDAKGQVSLSQPPVSFLYPEGYSRATSSVRLALADNSVLEVGCQGNRPFSRATGQTFDRAFKRMYRSGSVTLALGVDGTIYQVDGSGRSQPAPNLALGAWHELVPNQTMSFFSAQDLMM